MEAKHGLTSRQAEGLEYLSLRQAAGSPATLRELGQALGYSESPNAPARLIDALVRKGFVVKNESAKYHGVRVVRPIGGDDDKAFVAVGGDRVEIWGAKSLLTLSLPEAVRLCIALQRSVALLSAEKHPGAEDPPQGAEAGSRLPDSTGA